MNEAELDVFERKLIKLDQLLGIDKLCYKYILENLYQIK